MSAYYDVISRAVANLDENTATSRRALYERARSTVAVNLRTIAKEDFDRELLKLEDAIRQVEQNTANGQTSAIQQSTTQTEQGGGRKDWSSAGRDGEITDKPPSTAWDGARTDTPPRVSRDGERTDKPLSASRNEERADKGSSDSINSKEAQTKAAKRIPNVILSDTTSVEHRSAGGVSAIKLLASLLGIAFGRVPADGEELTVERKLRWATHFFIWSAIIVLFIEARAVFDSWWRDHIPQQSFFRAAAEFVGYMAGGLLLSGSPYVLALINGLVLRRYKSPISAGLFTAFGLIGFGLGVLLLMQAGVVYMSLASILFFGVYLSIAVWTYVALKRPTPDDLDEEAGN